MKSITINDFSELLLTQYDIYYTISHIIYNYAASAELIDPIKRIEKYLLTYSLRFAQIDFQNDIISKINDDEKYELDFKLTLLTLFDKKTITIPDIVVKHYRNEIENSISYMEMKIDEIINLFHQFVNFGTVHESYSIYKFDTPSGITKVYGKVSFDMNMILIKYDNLYYSIKRIQICSYQVDTAIQDMKYIVTQIEFDLYDNIISGNVYSSYIFAVLQ